MFIKPFNSPRPGGGNKKGGLKVNREIYAAEVRVIDENGKMLGVYSSSQAIQLAEQRGLDLIEISPTAKPPTCKIMDYGKWKYENKKKQVAARKNQIIVDTKEIQLRPRTDQHDLDTKIRHARRFILEGDKVKVNLRFSGREAAHQEMGLKVFDRVTEALNDIALVETPPKKEGRQVFMLFAADPIKIKEYQKKIALEEKAALKAAAAGAGGATGATPSTATGSGSSGAPKVTGSAVAGIVKNSEK
ncbi:MAG: translation initiation factor IF-3 [Bdellovibrionales bacterium]